MTPTDVIAVVGLGCVYPGAADVGAFWDNIVAGRDSIGEMPPDRVDPSLLADMVGRTGHVAPPGAGSCRARR